MGGFSDLFQGLRSVAGSKAGTEDAETAAIYTTPWAWRTAAEPDNPLAAGMYVGHNSEVWLYRALPMTPLRWEDLQVRSAVGRQLNGLLLELGQTSTAPMGAIAKLSNNREVHILMHSWQAPAVPPPGTPPGLTGYLEEVLDFLEPRRGLFVGVRLRPSIVTGSKTGLLDQLGRAATKVLAEDIPDIEAYAKDRDLISQIIQRAGGRPCTPEEYRQLEGWYNLGQAPQAQLVENPTTIEVEDHSELEFSALMGFEQKVMPALLTQWGLDVTSATADAPHMVSIRAQLEPAAVARSRARRSQRKLASSMDEEAATGDLADVKYSETFQLGQQLDQYFSGSSEALLSQCSIVMCRDVQQVAETYRDFLATSYGIQMVPLRMRQIYLLEETLPCATKRAIAFPQDLSLATIGYAGLQGFSALGDGKGMYTGLSDPDYTPVYVNPLGAPEANLPPVTGVFGDPGSGKTFLCQSFAIQAALGGLQTIMVNPKGGDTLASLVDFANEQGISAVRIGMRDMESRPGAFDPFRYAEPILAAEIASVHIIEGIPSLSLPNNDEDRIALEAGLRRGALDGARCVGDALKYVNNERLQGVIRSLAEANSLFGLGIGLEPVPPLAAQAKLTLIEFDRELGLPEGKNFSEYSVSERIAVSAVRLVTRASLEMLINAGSGVLILDEAWTFLSQPQSKAALQRISREGRSLNILPVFATQRIADVIDKDMEGYISRVFVMKLTEQREAEAAMRLCKLEATPARLEWLAQAGPRRMEDGTTQWARGLHRDLQGRHAAVYFGPTPEAAAEAFSTNPLDRKRRRDEADARNAVDAATGDRSRAAALQQATQSPGTAGPGALPVGSAPSGQAPPPAPLASGPDSPPWAGGAFAAPPR